MPDSTPKLVLREDCGAVCTLTLNRPEKHNAVTPPLFQQLYAHLEDLLANGSDLGVVVIRGAGRSFCAGHDLAEVGQMDTNWLRHESRGLELLARLPQIVIAAVHGYCFTGGLELALAADIIVASESAQFADTHGKYGLVPAWGLSQRLPRRVGASKALELMVTCRRLGAQEAERIGLVNSCVAESEFENAVSELASVILANSWHSNASNKRLVYDTDGMTLQAGMAHELFRSPGSQKREPSPAKSKSKRAS